MGIINDFIFWLKKKIKYGKAECDFCGRKGIFLRKWIRERKHPPKDKEILLMCTRCALKNEFVRKFVLGVE
ncbi:MAG: hypothetical protein ACXQS8_06730 [Candidatus Helarchaeales archaeon]